VILDLFPAGIHQLMAAMQEGLWFARSQEFLAGTAFQTMTWLRILGGSLFTVGGLFPLVWFISTRWKHMKSASWGDGIGVSISNEPQLVGTESSK